MHLPGAVSFTPSPASSRRVSFDAGPGSGSTSALAIDSLPELSDVQGAEQAPAPVPELAVPPQRFVGGTCTGRAAAVLGALVAGGQQAISQLVGVTARAGLQTLLISLAAGAFRPRTGEAGGNAPSVDDEAEPGNTTKTPFGNITEISNTTTEWSPLGSSDEGDFGNRTFVGNETTVGNGTRPEDDGWLGNISSLESSALLGLAGNASLALPGALLGGAGTLAQLAASVNASLVPHNASLPPSLSLPGSAAAQPVLLEFDGDHPGFQAAVAIASVIVGVSVLLCAGRVFELGKGALTALSGRRQIPDLVSGGRLGPAVVGTLGLMTAVAPLMIALRHDSAAAHGSDERALLATWLLINAAGRTCQNLLRDTTTQFSKPWVRSLNYLTRRGQPAGVGEPALGKAGVGTEAFRALQLDSRVVAARVLMTLISYSAGIYVCLRYVQPEISLALNTHDVSLRDQAIHSHPWHELFKAHLPAFLTSALIECLDSVTASLSASVAASGVGGASIELVPGSKSETRLQDILDHTAMRFFNAIFTVDLERAGNLMRGVDRSQGGGLALQTFALMLTDLRGFTVQFGQHYRKWSQTREQAPVPDPGAVEIEVLPLNAPMPAMPLPAAGPAGAPAAGPAPADDDPEDAAPVRFHVHVPWQ